MTISDNNLNQGLDLARPSFNELGAATFLGISVSALRKSRMNGLRENHLPPPPFHKLGRRVVYLKDDLKSYLQQYRCAAK